MTKNNQQLTRLIMGMVLMWISGFLIGAGTAGVLLS